jgi:hypothetical protein
MVARFVIAIVDLPEDLSTWQPEMVVGYNNLAYESVMTLGYGSQAPATISKLPCQRYCPNIPNSLCTSQPSNVASQTNPNRLLLVLDWPHLCCRYGCY